MNYKGVLKRAIDLHIHIGPEIIPRKFTLSKLLEYEKGKLRGVGIKNHYFSTAAMGSVVRGNGEPFIINSVVLNHYAGGFNSDIIRASAELSEKPIIVWFPTLHSKKFLQSQKNEIPSEWIKSKTAEKRFKPLPAKDIKPLLLFDRKGVINAEVEKVLYAIKRYNAILATGHISWEESCALVKIAVEKIGIKKIIITHPIYQKIDMPIATQKELASLGALMEHCYSMYSIDKIPMSKIAEQIKEVGAKNCILSSDVGQLFSKSPSESLLDFIYLLMQESITEREIKMMLIDNPAELIE